MSNESKSVSRWKLYAAGLTFTITVGFAFFGVKKCVPYSDPMTILTYRFGTSLIALLIVIAISKALGKYPEKRPGRPKARLYQTAFFYNLFMLLQVLAMMYSTSIEGAIVYAVVPIFAKIIGRIMLGERSTPLQNFFAVLTVAALMILIILNATDIRLNAAGLIIMAFATLSMAIENVCARYVRGVFTPLEISKCITISGFVVFFGITLIRSFIRMDFVSLIEPITHPEFAFWITYLGVLCILLSAQLMAFMLAHMEIIQSSIFNSACTLVSVVAGALILGEPLYWFHYLCGALILTGVIGLIFAPVKKANSGKSLQDDL